MYLIGSLILGMIITVLAVTLMILYVVVFVFGIGWLGQKLENLKTVGAKKNLQARDRGHFAERRTSG